jgi:hypothetical protein
LKQIKRVLNALAAFCASCISRYHLIQSGDVEVIGDDPRQPKLGNYEYFHLAVRAEALHEFFARACPGALQSIWCDVAFYWYMVQYEKLLQPTTRGHD